MKSRIVGRLMAAVSAFIIIVSIAFTAHAEIMISEICPKPTAFDPNGFESGWIELYNAGDTAVDLSGYTLERFNRGKAAKATYGALPSISLAAGARQIVYTCEDYPATVNDGKTPFVTNNCVVVPFKVNPKKYPMIQLKKGSAVLETFVVPVDLDDNKSFAPAGGAFPSYTGAAVSPALPQPPEAVEIAVDPSAVTTDQSKGVTAVDATASLAATNIWSLAFTFTIPSTEIPGAMTGLPLFNAPGAIYAYLDPDGQLEVQVGSANFQVDYEGIWTDGNPHTVELVCGPLADSRIALAVDGTNFVDCAVGVAAPLDTASSLLFGQITDDGDWTAFPGMISDVKLYNGSLLRIDYQGSVVSAETIAVPAAVTRVILPTLTKGTANNMTGAIAYGPNAGPLYGVKHSLSDWTAFPVATNGVDYAIEMMVNPLTTNANDQVVNVTLVYRAFAASGMVEKPLPMLLKSTDATAGAIYTNAVPAADLPAAGGLLQWSAIITDAAGNSWRTPSARSVENGYQWYGTIVQPTGAQVSATLPTWHFFCEQDTLDNMDKQKDNIKSTHPNGVFCGIYDSQTGLYYDHVLIDLRGNTTAGLNKKSHSLKFLKSQPLICTNPFDNEEIECRKTSLLAEYADPSRLRSCLSFYLRRLAGQDVPFCYPIRTQLNGQFYQLCFHTNRFKDELFEDYFTGYDPYGHAFKNCGDCDGTYCGGGVEQQLPDPDDYPSYISEYNAFKSQFVSYVRKNHPTQSGMTAADQAIVDKAVVKTFDLPGWINFLALSRLTQECDDGWSTLCLYYDVNRTGTWTPMAYDVHQSFGAYYKGDNYGIAGPWADQDRAKCHPYYGGMRVVSGNYSNNVSRANRAYECIYQSPKFRRLMARRLRTLMDDLLKAPGTTQADTPFWNDYAARLVTAMQADDVLDRAKWGLGTGGQLYVWSGSMTFAQGVDDLWNNYIVKRRVHFFNTHSVTNTAFSGNGYGAEFNACLPLAQSPIESLTNGFMIVNVEPDGSFADTEKVIIRNGNSETVDMSGWTLEGAMSYTLPAGTVVDANDTITITSDRKAYVTANDADLTDQVIVGNATVNAGVTAIALKDANGFTVTQGMEPEETVFSGDYADPVTLNMSGEKEFNNAHFNGGLILGSGVYLLKNPKNCLNTAKFISCGGKIIFKGKGTMTLADEGSDPLMTVGDLIVSNGTLKIEYTSTVAKSSAIQVSNLALVDADGTLDITVDGEQGYGLSLVNKNTRFTVAGGNLVADVSGTKCAAVNIKGSCDAKFTGGEVTAVLGGTNAKVVNGGSQTFSGSTINVTMPVDITGMLEARPFNADKMIKISGGAIGIDIPAYGSEAFATAESAGTIEMTGGTVEVRSGDDCISAFTDVTISGGRFYGTSISNDVIDANGNIAISGGTVLAYTTAVEEDANGSFGLDVNDGHTISITGGSVVALGGPDVAVHGSPAGCLVAETSGAAYSGKYVCVTGATDTAVSTLTVKLPEITTAKCTLLLYTPGVAADATPAVGDTAPASGSLDFHETYLTVEEIVTPAPDPSSGGSARLGKFLKTVQFTIDGYTGPAVDSPMPVLLRLSEGNPVGFSYGDCESDGSDLRFGDADFAPLPHEIDTWDPTGESLIWVKVPAITNDTVFNLAYSGLPKNVVDASAVWSGYSGVWHLNDTTATVDSYAQADYPNSTANAGLDGHVARTSVINQEGRFGKAFRVNAATAKSGAGYNDGGVWVNDSGANSVLDGTKITVSGWFKHGNFDYYYDHIFYKRTRSDNNTTTTAGVPALTGAFAIETSATANPTSDARGSSTVGVKVTYPDNMKADWAYLTFVYDDTTCYVYQNGAEVGHSTVAALVDNDVPFMMGNNNNVSKGLVGDAAWNGWIDEVRFLQDAKSADWIAAEYAAMATANLISAGEVEDVPSEEPTVQARVVSVKPQSATLNVLLSFCGDGATSCDLYLACGANANAIPAYTKIAEDQLVGASVEQVVRGLVSSTEYFYSAMAVNDLGVTNVMSGSFTTLPPREKTAPPAFGNFQSALRFTVSGYAGSETLTDYPVLVRLASGSPSGFDYAECAADGEEIRFADADGNLLSHEIETWNPVGTSLIWVKVPALEQDAEIMMYYNGTATSAVSATNTWSAYTGVWHMDEASGPVADETGHELTATPGGAAAAQQTFDSGICGNARVNSTSTSNKAYLSVPSYDSFALGSTFTMSGWVNLTACSGYPRIFSRKSAYTDANGWEMEMSSGSFVNFSARGINNAPTYSGALPVSLQDNWAQLVFVYNDATLDVYENGVLVKSGAITAATDNGKALGFGSNSTGSETHIVGLFDEFRLSDGCASADRIKADYDQLAGSGFLTASAALDVASDEPYFNVMSVSNDVSFTTAEVSASLAALGTGASAAEVSFAYGLDLGTMGAPVVLASAAEVGTVCRASLSGLAPDTTYFYVLCATNNAQYPYGCEFRGSFTTLAYGAPELSDEFVNGVEAIQLKATLESAGTGSTTADLYLAYGTDASNLPAPAPMTAAMAEDTTYTATISGLESGVTVSYRWVAVNDRGVTNILAGTFTPGIDFRRPDVNIAEYSRGVKMTITGYTESETLTNFPVLVRLTENNPTGFSYADFYSADGSDLVFVGADGTILAHEVDTWDPNGESLVWVQLPEFNNGVEFSMWYRSSKPGSVFTSDPMWAAYVGVWHLGEGGNGVQSVMDSTTNALNGTTHVNSLEQPAGIIGAARRVSTKGGNSAANGQILIELNNAQKATLNNMVPTFTFSTWFAFRSTGNGPDYAFLCASKDNDKDPGWGIQFNNNSSAAPSAMRVHSAGSADSQCATYSKAVTMRTWYKINMVWDGTTYRAYYDGVQSNTGTLYNSMPAIMGTSGRIAFGGMTGSGYGSFNGDMDEIRLKKGASSAAWIKAEYLNETTDLISSGDVVVFTERPKPVGTLAMTDFGASFAQFAATLSSLGDGATTAEFQGKVWTGDEPAAWTTLATGLVASATADAVWTGLSPETTYSYKLRAVCDAEGAQPSDAVEGTFTTVGTGAAGQGGKVSVVGNDYVHVYDIYSQSFAFVPPAGVSSVELLLVGGGGAGGHTHGGGGAGGSVTALPAVEVTAGETYTVEIGAGGVASAVVGTDSTAGGTTSFKLGDTVLESATGGQPGGNNLTCAGGSNDNFAGGAMNTSKNSGGGGAGAGQVGGAASNDSPVSGGSGGNGFVSTITGKAVSYGGGGGGGTGTTGTLANPSSAGVGGLGGGGNGGGGNVAVETDAAPTAGQDGLGGGGGGGAVSLAAYLAGANGGSGFAAIRYTMTGTGAGSDAPIVTLDSATYEGDLQVRLAYRVGWAGEGADTASVKLLWGYTPTSITRELSVSDAAIGTGVYVFSAPLDETTYYFRLEAANGDDTSLSGEILSVTVPDYAGDVPGDNQVPIFSGSAASVVSDAHWADISSAITSFGEGADTCEVTAYVGLTDDVNMMTNQVWMSVSEEDGFTYRLVDLDLDTTYYCYLEARNNLGAAVATSVISFTTRSGSALSTVATSVNQQTFTVSGSLLTVGAGTTDIYVSWDNAPYELVASFNAASNSTVYTSTYRKPTWGNASYKVLSSNECTTATDEMSGEFWTDLRTGSIAPADTSTYTWKADGEGNWNGNWNDPAHWDSNKADCIGYPSNANTPASFANCTLENPVTVTVNGKYTVSSLTCVGNAASDITFVGNGRTESQLSCGALPEKMMKSNSKLRFEDMTLLRNSGVATWYICQGNVTTNLDVSFSGVTMSGVTEFVFVVPYSRMVFENCTTNTFTGKFSLGGTNTVAAIDNSTVLCTQFFAPADAPGNGVTLKLMGAAPVLRATTSYFATWNNPEDLLVEFTVPEGGYATVPVQITSATHKFAQPGSASANHIVLSVAENSPALMVTNRIENLVLVSAPAGFSVANMTEGIGTVPMNGEIELGEFKYGLDGAEVADAADAKQILLDLVGYIHEEPGYSEGDDVGGLILSVAQAEWLNGYIGEGGFADKASLEAAIAAASSDGIGLSDKFLLGLDPSQPDSYMFAVSGITVVGTTISVTVTLTRANGAVKTVAPIRGTLKLKAAENLDAGFGTSAAIDISGAFDGTETETFEFADEDNRFFKAVIE